MNKLKNTFNWVSSNIGNILLLWFFSVMFFVSCILIIDEVNDYNNRPKVGQKYLYSHNYVSQDPFLEIKPDTVKVLDYKDGYILFIINGKKKSKSEYIFDVYTRELKTK